MCRISSSFSLITTPCNTKKIHAGIGFIAFLIVDYEAYLYFCASSKGSYDENKVEDDEDDRFVQLVESGAIDRLFMVPLVSRIR